MPEPQAAPERAEVSRQKSRGISPPRQVAATKNEEGWVFFCSIVPQPVKRDLPGPAGRACLLLPGTALSRPRRSDTQRFALIVTAFKSHRRASS